MSTIEKINAVKVIETPWGIIRTPVFVYFIGFAMILFSLFTIDLGKYISGIAFLSFIFEYFRAMGLIKLSFLAVLMRFGFDISIYGGLWKFCGGMGLTNENRHYGMLVLCLIVSLLIIKIFNWEEGIISASHRTIIEGFNSMIDIIEWLVTKTIG